MSLASLSRGRALARRLDAERTADGALPLLATLMDLDSARGWWADSADLRRLRSADGLLATRVLRYRPGRRAALRLDFEGGESVYVKLVALRKASRARRSARRLRRLSGQGPCPDLRLPEVLAVLEDEGALLLSAVPGRPWEEELDEPSLARSESGAVAGRALARWQGLSTDRLPEWTREQELDVLGRGRRRLEELGHPLAPSLVAAIEDLAPALDSAFEAPGVLAHRDLHPQQVLIEGGVAGFVDLDDLAVAPAVLDLGNVLGHLDLFGLHEPDRARLFAESGACFASAHAERAGPVAARDLAAARVATLLRLGALHAGTEDRLATALHSRAGELLRTEVTQ